MQRTRMDRWVPAFAGMTAGGGREAERRSALAGEQAVEGDGDGEEGEEDGEDDRDVQGDGGVAEPGGNGHPGWFGTYSTLG